MAPIVLLALLAGPRPQDAAAAPTTYHVTKRWTVGGEGGWDYLTADGRNHRLYVSRGTHVMVVDTETGSVAGDIPNTNGVHGIALAPDLGKGFTSNGRDNSVTIFDLTSLKTTGNVSVGKNPDAILYVRGSHRVFTFNGGSSDSTAVDANTGAVVGTVPLDGRPEFCATDNQGHVYCNIEDKSEIAAIDASGPKVTKTWSIAPGEGPSGLAIDARNHRLFSVCGNGMMVISDAEKGAVVTTVPIGKGPDAAGFDPRTGLAFSSNGRDGTLTVVHEDTPDKFTVVQTVTTEPGARTMAVDRRTHEVYLVTAKFGPLPEAQPGQQGQRFRRPPMLLGTFVILVVSQK